jgi:hypothetical protein
MRRDSKYSTFYRLTLIIRIISVENITDILEEFSIIHLLYLTSVS